MSLRTKGKQTALSLSCKIERCQQPGHPLLHMTSAGPRSATGAGRPSQGRRACECCRAVGGAPVIWEELGGVEGAEGLGHRQGEERVIVGGHEVGDDLVAQLPQAAGAPGPDGAVRAQGRGVALPRRHRHDVTEAAWQSV